MSSTKMIQAVRFYLRCLLEPAVNEVARGWRRILPPLRMAVAVGLLWCCQQNQCHALAMGEVVARSEHGITIRDPSGGLTEIDALGGVEFVAEIRVGPADLTIGQLVMVQGVPGEMPGVHPRLIRILPADAPLPSALTDPAGGSIAGRIRATNPMVVQSEQGDIELIIDDRIEILREQRVSWQGLVPGNRVRLIGSPGQPRKIVLVGEEIGQLSPPLPNGKPLVDAQTAFPPEPALPLPTIPTVDHFSYEAMERSRSSHFGLKDPLMYRMDPLSWFEGYAEAMTELGIFWMEPAGSFGIGPASLRQADGSLSWQRFDRLVAHAQAANIHMTVILHATDENYGRFGRPIPTRPKDFPAYRRFVTEVVERYDADGKGDMPGLRYPIRHWKIEDEAMLPHFFNGQGADYAEIAAAAYDSIKAADPEATVILSMLRGYDALPAPVNAFMDDFLATAAAMGRGPFWDVIDHHWMVYGDPAAYALQYRNIASELAQIRARLKHYGIALRPVWCMEVAGLYSSRRAQAIDLFKRHVYALSQGVEKVFWSGLAESPQPAGGELGGIATEMFRQAALIDSSGNKKASFHTLRHLVEAIDGFSAEDLQVLRDDHGVFLVRIVVDRRPLWIAWNDLATPQAISLATGMRRAAFKIETAIPEGLSPDLSGDGRPVFPAQAARSGSEGTLDLDLGEVPVIIRPDR